MTKHGLSRLQVLILKVLAPVRPRWTLTGGGALSLCHLSGRTTRDLDLFFLGANRLEDALRSVNGLLEESGLAVTTLQSSPGFVRLRVSDGREVTVVELRGVHAAST